MGWFKPKKPSHATVPLKHTDREIDVFILVNRNDNLKDKNMYLLRYGSTHKICPYHNIGGY